MRHSFLVLGAVTLFAFPLSAQTVDLATRTFWTGERPKTMDVDSPFIALLDIEWIEDALGNEPVFKGAALQIEQELGPDGNHSVARSVAHLLPGEIELGPEALPPQFRIPGYRMYGDPRDKKVSPVYVPDDPSAGYKVACGWVVGEDRFSVCTVFATYAPDDNIRLKAALYFPPDPIDQPTRFRDVVERLREVAYCLDVTEGLIDVPTVFPDLKGCKPEETS
jgi:hypothetical protein